MNSVYEYGKVGSVEITEITDKYKNAKSKKEQYQLEHLLFREIIKKLEWSKLSYSGAHKPSLFCCMLCRGIRPDEYN